MPCSPLQVHSAMHVDGLHNVLVTHRAARRLVAVHRPVAPARVMWCTAYYSAGRCAWLAATLGCGGELTIVCGGNAQVLPHLRLSAGARLCTLAAEE